MIQDAYLNHIKGHKSMNNLSIADIASFATTATAIGSVIYWGGGLEKRLKAIESWRTSIEDRQTRIEDKIDNLAIQTTTRLDAVQKNILDAILKK